MRSLALAAPLLLALVAGCTAPFDPHAGEDCSGVEQSHMGMTAMALLPADVPDDARAEPRARLTVHARAGQTLQGQVVWSVTQGQATVLFDGPASTAVQTDHAWTAWNVTVPEGDYTLELAGKPMAAGVTYSMFLMATGCTPPPSA